VPLIEAEFSGEMRITWNFEASATEARNTTAICGR
jgi:hypothetical protein